MRGVICHGLSIWFRSIISITFPFFSGQLLWTETPRSQGLAWHLTGPLKRGRSERVPGSLLARFKNGGNMRDAENWGWTGTRQSLCTCVEQSLKTQRESNRCNQCWLTFRAVPICGADQKYHGLGKEIGFHLTMVLRTRLVQFYKGPSGVRFRFFTWNNRSN